MQRPYIGPDGEVGELDQNFFARAKRGRPQLPESVKKRRVNLMLDPDVATRLLTLDNSSAFVNGLLRKSLGI
jgi:hypothetical protein